MVSEHLEAVLVALRDCCDELAQSGDPDAEREAIIGYELADRLEAMHADDDGCPLAVVLTAGEVQPGQRMRWRGMAHRVFTVERRGDLVTIGTDRSALALTPWETVLVGPPGYGR